MNASAIIVAAGSGVRLGRSEPKAFVKIGGRTMLSYSLRVIASVEAIGELVIAAPDGFEAAARAEVVAAGVRIPVKITRGGAERQTRKIFEACLEAAARSGGAIAAIPLADTLKRVVDSAIAETIARAELWQAQTPQAFRREVLVAAHRRAVNERIVATDDADLVERNGTRVEIVEGSSANIKITTPPDLAIVEAIVAPRMV